MIDWKRLEEAAKEVSFSLLALIGVLVFIAVASAPIAGAIFLGHTHPIIATVLAMVYIVGGLIFVAYTLHD